jgi:DNA-binding MarR family transcriptional regulator
MNEISSSAAERDAAVTRVGMALHSVIQAVESARDRAAKGQNLHPTDFSCIGYLYHAEGPVSPKQVIAYLNLSSGSGTALLDRLERAGYTRRLPNPDDRRSILIELDPERAAEPIRRFLEIEHIYRELTGALSTTELDVVARFLEQMGALTAKAG